jgi:uncharacterized CHY-type Zn-finger protein
VDHNKCVKCGESFPDVALLEICLERKDNNAMNEKLFMCGECIGELYSKKAISVSCKICDDK